MTLRLAPRQYLTLEGLAVRDALAVGRAVEAGEPLGTAGELVIYLMDAAELGEGIPLSFRGLVGAGGVSSGGVPRPGATVRNGP